MKKDHKIIISVAPVAAASSLIPEEVSEDIKKAAQAGASMCHLHCKTTQGILTSDITNLSAAFTQIRLKSNIILQASTGGISEMNMEERCRPLFCEGVESASLNGGSTNLGEAIYKNSFEDIRYCADLCYEKNILPEIEVFDIGMIHNIQYLKQKCRFRDPLLFNLVFGHKGGMQPTIKDLTAFCQFLPQNAVFGVTHFGRTDWKFLAAAIAMGAAIIRIGFEDSAYLSENEEAKTNAQLVKKLVTLAEAMEVGIATPEEAREILQLKKENNK